MRVVPSDLGRRIAEVELFARDVLRESYQLLDSLEPELKRLGYEAVAKYRWTPPGSARRGEVPPRDVSQGFFPAKTRTFKRFVEAVVVLQPGEPEFLEPLFMMAVHELSDPASLDDKGFDFSAWLYDLVFHEPSGREHFEVDGTGEVFRLTNGRGEWRPVRSIRGFAIRLVGLAKPEDLERCALAPLRLLLDGKDADAAAKLAQLGDDLARPLAS